MKKILLSELSEHPSPQKWVDTIVIFNNSKWPEVWNCSQDLDSSFWWSQKHSRRRIYLELSPASKILWWILNNYNEIWGKMLRLNYESLWKEDTKRALVAALAKGLSIFSWLKSRLNIWAVFCLMTGLNRWNAFLTLLVAIIWAWESVEYHWGPVLWTTLTWLSRTF